ncbi:mannosyltransferase PIG-V [Rhodoglobus vestalii]|uniref:Mannosyltransferase PIG-V n=1 Tax=Rhodoglobus vestalii TaxID=193384 RepID=A0A8H2PWI2_9MICO|nr:mannosyltransferase family protein [Rhodoglobus vestalii]TQO19210.1 mannosyltransferase PIG-V [Rhodoglobus vestalii]
MADRSLASAVRRATTAVLAPERWWVAVIAIFAASRVVTTSILLAYASIQPANSWTGPRPDYFSFAKIWDGHWYYIIALTGYPTELPRDDAGYVAENAWAFMPVYPAIVRFFMTVTTLDFAVVAVIVSLGFALAAALVFYRMMNHVLPARTALFSVVIFCFAPLSAILQVAYAESMSLFLLMLALYWLMKRHYWMLFPVIAVMSLTRPSGLAFALALGLHVVYRWWVRGRDGFPRREAVAAVSATVFSVVMGFAWLLIAAAVTGSLSAYTDTELAWRAPYIGHVELVPFAAWFQAAGFWAAWWNVPQWLLSVLIVAGVLGFFGFLLTRPARRLGVDLRLWLVSYALYILAVFFPQSSTFRLLMPMFPLAGILAQPKSPRYRILLVLACIAGQWGWIHIGWWVDNYDWSPP